MKEYISTNPNINYVFIDYHSNIQWLRLWQ
jgi:hypothetical protein